MFCDYDDDWDFRADEAAAEASKLNPNAEMDWIVCPDCNGSGEGWHDGASCSRCGGSGEILAEVADDELNG